MFHFSVFMQNSLLRDFGLAIHFPSMSPLLKLTKLHLFLIILCFLHCREAQAYSF